MKTGKFAGLEPVPPAPPDASDLVGATGPVAASRCDASELLAATGSVVVDVGDASVGRPRPVAAAGGNASPAAAGPVVEDLHDASTPAAPTAPPFISDDWWGQLRRQLGPVGPREFARRVRAADLDQEPTR